MKTFIAADGFDAAEWEDASRGTSGLRVTVQGIGENGERSSVLLFDEAAAAFEQEIVRRTPQGMAPRDMKFIIEFEARRRVSQANRREYLAASSYAVLEGPELALQQARFDALATLKKARDAGTPEIARDLLLAFLEGFANAQGLARTRAAAPLAAQADTPSNQPPARVPSAPAPAAVTPAAATAPTPQNQPLQAPAAKPAVGRAMGRGRALPGAANVEEMSERAEAQSHREAEAPSAPGTPAAEAAAQPATEAGQAVHTTESEVAPPQAPERPLLDLDQLGANPAPSEVSNEPPGAPSHEPGSSLTTEPPAAAPEPRQPEVVAPMASVAEEPGRTGAAPTRPSIADKATNVAERAAALLQAPPKADSLNHKAAEEAALTQDTDVKAAPPPAQFFRGPQGRMPGMMPAMPRPAAMAPAASQPASPETKAPTPSEAAPPAPAATAAEPAPPKGAEPAAPRPMPRLGMPGLRLPLPNLTPGLRR